MKITKLETFPVTLPVGKFADGQDKVGGRNAPDKYDQGKATKVNRRKQDGITYLSNVIVKIHTDGGFVGIGEAACDTAEPVWSVCHILEKYMQPLLIGQDPLQWEYLIDLVSREQSRGTARFATAGIDIALHDLVGKILGIPVCTLIGGRRRERVLASIEVPRNTPEKMAEHSWEYYQQGVRGIKAKVGSNPRLDAESIKAIREKLGPDISLRADANRGYTVKEAILFCRLVEEYDVDLEVLEQPVDTLDMDGHRTVKDATSIPIEVDESAYSLHMVFNILKAGAADWINTKCAKASGIMGVRKWTTVAEAANIPVVIGTEWGCCGIVAAKLHLGSALAHTNPVVEFTEIMIHDMLMKEPLKLVDGYLQVPTAPGLGFDPDPEKLERYRTPM